MAQAKRKTVAKTAKKAVKSPRQRSQQKASGKRQQQAPNTFFLVSMSFLAATLLVANLLMLNL